MAEAVLVAGAAIHLGLVEDIDGKAEGCEHAGRQAGALEDRLQAQGSRIVDHQPCLGARHAAEFRERVLNEAHMAQAQRAHDQRRRQAAIEVELLYKSRGIGRQASLLDEIKRGAFAGA